jgi:hypothetical protein
MLRRSELRRFLSPSTLDLKYQPIELTGSRFNLALPKGDYTPAELAKGPYNLLVPRNRTVDL